MSTPSKKRRKNDFKPSPQPVKSIDFFFNKQRQAQELKRQEPPIEFATSQEVTKDHSSKPELTDEELAWQLQEQWSREDEERLPKSGGGDSDAQERELTSFESSQAPSGPTSVQAHQAEEPKEKTLALQSSTSTEDVLTITIPLDEHPLSFEPSRYLPDLKSQWQSLEAQASYGILIRAFVLINSTQSRIKIVDTLVNFLRLLIEGDPQSLLPAVSRCEVPAPYCL